MMRANGKLLLTGEYVVLDGALSLALPTKKGQTLTIKPNENGFLWTSLNSDGAVWFSEFLFSGSKNEVVQTLEKIIQTAIKLNPDFQNYTTNIQVETFLEFPRDWGLGSSSTLISLIAKWAKINPYDLLEKSFGGSGYDIACANAQSPILYQLNNGKRNIYPIDFQIDFSDKLFFIHLNKKQNSREGISRYKKNKCSKTKLIAEITEITEQLLRNPSFSDFCVLLDKHEALISNCIELPTVKDALFSDFQGSIKSLGAWGGDFVLVAGEKNEIETYFLDKGFSTIIAYNDMILS